MTQANKTRPTRAPRPTRSKPWQESGIGKKGGRGRAGRDTPPSRASAARGATEGSGSRFGRSRPPRNTDQHPEATVKLQKRLAEAGLGSRRAMEELIQAGEVNVNGKVARIGMRVTADDRIVVRGEAVANRSRHQTGRLPKIVLYHKPEGEIVTRDDPAGRPSVFERAGFLQRGRWLAVGRLDFNTCGLLIFTDSGELANRLSHPRFQMRRDYAVRIVGELNAEQIRLLKSGIQLDDGIARCEVLESQGGEGSNRWYRVRVREGRNRLVRRMFQAAGFTVSRLLRTGFGPFELPPRVKRGQWLQLDEDAVRRSLTALPHASNLAAESKRAAKPPRRVARPAESPRAAEGKPQRPPRRSRST